MGEFVGWGNVGVLVGLGVRGPDGGDAIMAMPALLLLFPEVQIWRSGVVLTLDNTASLPATSATTLLSRAQ